MSLARALFAIRGGLFFGAILSQVFWTTGLNVCSGTLHNCFERFADEISTAIEALFANMLFGARLGWAFSSGIRIVNIGLNQPHSGVFS
jgi:hypothetical protein